MTARTAMTLSRGDVAAAGLPSYRVTALKMATLGADRSALVMLTDPGTALEIPVWAAAIEGNGMRIVVDTGVRDPAWVQAHTGQMCRQESDETMEGALAEIGCRPRDVDLVINTHLHYDHVGFNTLFAHTRIVVGATEWDTALTPVATQRVLYAPREWLLAPLSPFHYAIVGVDHHDVAPGIRMISTPGHSLGHMSVLVNTDDGVLCIAGDAVNADENFMGTPGGIHVSVPDALRSADRIGAVAETVLMAHDGRVSKYQTGGFPRVPVSPGRPS